MKKSIVITVTTILLAFVATNVNAQISIGGRKINVKKVANAVTDVAKAAALSDSDIELLSRDYVKWMDEHNPLAKEGSEYYSRIQRLTKDLHEVDGMKLNFGVYEVVDVNAFACGDGSVRVCAGLMDLMTDDEVMAVIGHEIGHVVNKDVKDAIKNAYLRSAASNVAGAVSQTVASLSDSQLGDLAEALADGQFSQKQEYSADDYGFNFCVKRNIDAYSMYNSLNKLLTLSEGNSGESKFRKLFASHPDTEKRVKRMKEKADKFQKK